MGSDSSCTDRRFATGAISALLLVFVACDGQSPTAPSLAGQPPTEDSIRVASIAPAAGTSLRPGQQVTFNATVSYQLATADTGLIRIVVQDQTNRIIQAIPRNPRQDRPVERGSGQVSFTDVVAIPASGVTAVRVFFPLFPEGVVQTSMVAVVSYEVR